LLEAARQVWLTEKNYTEQDCRFHHISTDEVFGTLSGSDPAFTETTAYEPNSPYSASKASSDHLVRAYFATYQLPMTLTNCSNNYGPYQHTEKFIPTVIRACLQQKPIPIYGDGSNIRDWLYVDDHCIAIHKVICDGVVGDSYNIGGENELSNLALVNHICAAMDARYPANAPHEKLITFVTDRPGHDWRYAIDTTKLKAHDLWQAPTAFDQALIQTIEFYSHD
jgi:dTDP-glucose 4,6-dehydratase